MWRRYLDKNGFAVCSAFMQHLLPQALSDAGGESLVPMTGSGSWMAVSPQHPPQRGAGPQEGPRWGWLSGAEGDSTTNSLLLDF